MTIVLTNDDGIDAPGIHALLKAVRQFTSTIAIAAPRDPQSGCGHQVTTSTPIQVEQRTDLVWSIPEVSAYAIAGTPADCTRIALSHLFPHAQCILSGINAGGNLGSDVYISGTVAAVREAAMHRVPGIAISHYRQGKRAIEWDLAAHLTAKVLADLLVRPSQPGAFWNVNLPHLEPGAPDPAIVFCPPCTQPLPVNYRIQGNHFFYAGEYSKRQRDPGADVAVCFAGNIAVTQLQL